MMFNDKQMRDSLENLLRDTQTQNIIWRRTKRCFRADLGDYHFYLFSQEKKLRTEIFAIQKGEKPIYIAWLRPGYENFDILALISHELQKSEN